MNDRNLYSALWLAGTYEQDILISTSFSDFTQKWDDWGNNRDLRMEDFEAIDVGSTKAYIGVFDHGTDSNKASITKDWAEFEQNWDDFGKENLRMHDYESYVVGNTRFYAGIFREGTDGHDAWIVNDWDDFIDHWETNNDKNLRMHDFETYIVGKKRVYAGVFRGGKDLFASTIISDWDFFTKEWDKYIDQNPSLRITDIEIEQNANDKVFAAIFHEGNQAHYAWLGVDWENMMSKWKELEPQNLRMVDIEATATSSCSAACLNQVVMLCTKTPLTDCDLYNYPVTATATHCEGEPGTCPTPPSGSVMYRQPIIQPVLPTDKDHYIRLSALDVKDQIFTLPFSDDDPAIPDWHNGWLYSSGNWHHAVDYARTDADTFQIRAAAPGTVIHIGWDNWSGNTIVVSHNANGVTDAYRTIYMHMKNGPDNDCKTAWDQTMPWLLSNPDKAATAVDYEDYLEATGCPKATADRDPGADQWGTDAQAIGTTLLGKNVKRGELLGWAGSTGPGGCGCTGAKAGSTEPNHHLHIFFARRDPTDDQWYLFDPYGIYGPADCYPEGMTDAEKKSCARYPIAWENSKPEYPD